MNALKKKMPFIGCDIDGVLKKGSQALPFVTETVKLIRDKNIPFLLVTNSGGNLESVRAKLISKIVGLENDPKYEFKANEIMLCHTPMRLLAEKYKDKIVLVMGIDKTKEVVEDYGFKNYITVNEFSNIYSQELLPFKRYYAPQNEAQLKEESLKVVEERLKIDLTFPPKIDCILTLTDVRTLFEAVQVINTIYKDILRLFNK